MGGILLVAATERELGGRPGLACGVGPVEAAASIARELALRAGTFDAVLHVGIAGAHGLPLRSVVVGSESRYLDLAAAISVVDTLLPSHALVAAACAALPSAVVAPITTSARVGSLKGDGVEAMEGFGVLRAAALAGIPAVEVRVVSNEIGEPDRSRWDFVGALGVLDEAIDTLLAALAG